ncbi:MAG: hypothetical protein IJA45_02530 [Oscillospiraceae bacterium]|nr:hypothetical protein [Oscillospiraceae bacterium]
MKNMFSGNDKKSIPNTLDECTRIDAVSNNLWIWSERLENWGRILFFLLVVIGIISTIAEGVSTHELLQELGKEIDPQELAALGYKIPSVFDVVLVSLFMWGLYAFLEYCAYHVLALLIGALASITQNTIITANAALLTANMQPNIPKTTPQETTAKTNSATSTQAAPKSEPPRKIVTRPTPPPPGMWQCKNCGTNNKDNYSQCKQCGQYRS